MLVVWATACGDDPVGEANRPPATIAQIASATIPSGDSLQLDLSNYFTDPDGDNLTYSATSSNPGVAALSVSGSTVTVSAMSQGSATATVTATDPGGLSTSQSFEVTVPNRAPEVRDSIPAQQLDRREPVQLEMAAYFTDPDGDTLTYSLQGPSILEINSRTGEITNTKGGVPIRGRHKLTVTATDPDGESASTSFYLAIALAGDGTDATANAHITGRASRFRPTLSQSAQTATWIRGER